MQIFKTGKAKNNLRFHLKKLEKGVSLESISKVKVSPRRV